MADTFFDLEACASTRVSEKITRGDKQFFWTDIEDEGLTSTHQKHILDNHALKYLRACGENPPGCPTVNFIDITDDDVKVPLVVRGGPIPEAFKFDMAAAKTAWSWKKML